MHRRLITLSLVMVMITGILYVPVHAQEGREPLRHVVQPGENLFRIALKYDLTTEVLLRANPLVSPDLVIVGQVLIIPGHWADEVAGAPVSGSAVAVSPSASGAGEGGAPAPGEVAPDATDLGIIGVDVEYAAPLPDTVADQGILPATGALAPVAPAPAAPAPAAAAAAAPAPADAAAVPADPSLTGQDMGIIAVDGALVPAAPAPADAAASDAAVPADPSLTGQDMGIITPGTASWAYQPGIFTTGGASTRAIYARGQLLGNNPHAFSTVGDCNSEIPYFLAKFDRGEYNLGPYDYLQPVIDQFAGSFDRDSAAVWTGNHVWALFDPVWANPAVCLPGEIPLACEFRIQRPVIVLIRLGTNEAGSTTLFEQNMREVIEFSIEKGVIPLLGTKADRLEGSDAHNEIIRRLAVEYGVPLWDFGRVADTLPGRGLRADGFHLTYVAPDYTQPLAMQTGHSVQNLAALIALYTVWRSVDG